MFRERRTRKSLFPLKVKKDNLFELLHRGERRETRPLFSVVYVHEILRLVELFHAAGKMEGVIFFWFILRRRTRICNTRCFGRRAIRCLSPAWNSKEQHTMDASGKKRREIRCCFPLTQVVENTYDLNYSMLPRVKGREMVFVSLKKNTFDLTYSMLRKIEEGTFRLFEIQYEAFPFFNFLTLRKSLYFLTKPYAAYLSKASEPHAGRARGTGGAFGTMLW